MPPRTPVDVYLEVGTKRTFAGSLEWPGWCRSGRDEASAIDALLAYAPRYAEALRGGRLGFHAPSDARVVERLRGDATTDFGAPSAAPSTDAEPMSDADLRRAQALLGACWRTFEGAVGIATGRELRKGPRGGGRTVGKMVDHVLDAEAAYLSMIGVKRRPAEGGDLAQVAAIALAGLTTAVRDGVPPSPRGGKRWTPRYYVRRSAWHVLDHAWEIGDRLEP